MGIAASYILPPKYVSQTLVLVQQQKVSEDYVKPIVNEDLNGRLASMKEQILSRSRIQPVIEKFGLYSEGRYTMDDRIELTRKAIGVTPIHSEQAHGGMPGFFISFTARDPKVAQMACGEITSLFVNENLDARVQSAEGTTAFLKQQLAEAKTNLDEQDAKLAAFEQKYIGKLPDQKGTNSNTLQALTTQLDAATQSVNRAQQEVTFLEAMVSQQSEARSDPAVVTRQSALADELKELRKQKEALDATYTPDHPDVIAIKRQIQSVQSKMAAEAADQSVNRPASQTHTDSLQLQQLRAQLRAARQSLDAAKQMQARIQNQVGAYESKLEAAPVIEEEYQQVTRDHETALQFYNSLLRKMNESSMASELEHRRQGEQFQVMDDPNLPDRPKFPNRRLFAAGGLAGGLFLGLLLTGLLEYRDTSLRTEQDVLALTTLPVLAVLSHISEMPQRAERGLLAKLVLPKEDPIELARPADV
jgi:polysaccharide chain length determinant protein (PEP-CTERM system associated)